MVLVTAEGELALELRAAPGGALLAEQLLSLPSVVDSAARFLDLPVRTITAIEHCVCVMQGEFASIDLRSSLAPALMGSGEATTCVVVFVCCKNTGRVCVAHYDTTCLQHPASVDVVIEVCCTPTMKLSYKVQQPSKQKGNIASLLSTAARVAEW